MSQLLAATARAPPRKTGETHNMTTTIVINMDKRCRRCGKAGATEGGLCLRCVAEDIKLRLRCVAEDIKQLLAAEKPRQNSKL